MSTALMEPPVGNSPAPGVIVAPGAVKRIRALLADEPPGTCLRVSITGGGCSGFQYNFLFDTERQLDDLVIEAEGATVLVDSVSLDLLSGSVIDYVEDLMGASFQVRNPHAASSCGCGTSFAV